MANEDEEAIQEDKLRFNDLTWGAPPKKKMKVKKEEEDIYNRGEIDEDKE